MADFRPIFPESSQFSRLGHSSCEDFASKKQARQLWKKIGLVSSVVAIGGQPVLAQIDAPLGDMGTELVAAETAPPVDTVAPVVHEAAPVAPVVISAPEVAAPVFSPQTTEIEPAAVSQVEAITSQVEVVTSASAPLDTAEAVDSMAAPAAESSVTEVTESQSAEGELTEVSVTPGVDIVTPSDVVPSLLPTAQEQAADYGNVFVDPSAFSEGETASPQAPDVVISERSTGCEYTVNGEQAEGCDTAITRESTQQVAEAGIKIGPVSISRSGVRFTGGATTVAGREYYNTIAKPLVELQAGESFVFPLASPSPITSLFGWRLHPIFHDYRFHSGTDLGAPQGTPILATQSGQVSVADYLGGYGLTVIMRHSDNTLETRYAHMSHILVQPGEWVEQGEVIGLVGSTGNSTGPHLHFELRQLTRDGWVALNPDEILSYALANLNNRIGSGNPLQALNIFPKAQAMAKGSLAQDLKTETLVSDAPNFRPAQPNAQ